MPLPHTGAGGIGRGPRVGSRKRGWLAHHRQRARERGAARTQGADHRRIELIPGPGLDGPNGGRKATGQAVRSVRGEGVERIRDRQDPDRERDVFPLHAVGVAASIPMLVVMANTVEARFQEMQAFEHLIADDRVLAHRRGFFLIQWAWLPEYTILDADFPDVMQRGWGAQR